MKFFVFLILAVFASDKKENDTTNDQNYGENNEENSIFVKIEEDEHDKVKKSSRFIGVSCVKNKSKWYVQRRSKKENKIVGNGCYDDEETAAHASDTLARNLMKNGKQNHKLNFPDNHTEVYPEEKRYSSKFIGVNYNKRDSKWYARRWSKNENKQSSNGYYNDEETAAHASDTLAKELMENGENGHKLNFPDDHTMVHRGEKKNASKFIGLSYYADRSKWVVQRWSKNGNKVAYNGCYDDEETAAHASDTLAKTLMKNGEQKFKLNFPDNEKEVYREEKSSEFIGVSYIKKSSKWRVYRWSTKENKNIYNGYYDDEETAAHASDTLERKLIENGEKNHKLNFPDDDTEVYREVNKKKRKRQNDFHLTSSKQNVGKQYQKQYNKC